ncbi:MAG: TldD/PmbA family protein [Syntrophomonadaceae bacterium]
MLDRDLLAAVLDTALKKGGQFAEIYVEDRLTSNILCDDDRIERIHSGREKGAGIRLIEGGRTFYVYTNDLSREGLIRAAGLVSHGVDTSCPAPRQATELRPIDTGLPVNFRRLPQQVDFAEKIDYVLKANRVARDLDDDIRQVTVAAGDLHKRVQIANSYGEYVEDETARVRLMVNAVAVRGGQVQTGQEVAGGVSGWELLEQVSAEDMAAKAARRAIAMLSASPAPAGRMPVVMHSEAGGTMIHEACGHGLEADLVQKGLSVYRDKIGQLVASPIVTVIDDPTLPGKYGSYRWDDEASPAQRTLLIENGYLRGYLNDRLSASKAGTVLTGNGRRESYMEKPIPRMSNTFIAPGRDDPDSIIRETGQGLLVKKMGGGQVNTANGDFIFDVQEGYMIENGEVSYPVRGATLIGNGPRTLMDIDRVGSDLGFAIGVCGKEGQGVPVGDAQPTIRIRELTVGGTSMSGGPTIKRIRRK